MQVTSERAILKDLGSWPGTITLARDKPIRHKNISFKDLLGFESGRLIVAIPFVCKTLEPCAKYKVFKPPNPWLMAVISLLAELYHLAELKLNLKFEIEVLCKGLDVDLDTVEATMIFRNSLSMNGFERRGIQGEAQVMSLGAAASTETQRAIGAHIESILTGLASSVIISPQLAPLHVNHSFKRAVQLAVDRSIREVYVLCCGASFAC
jgi:CCR4-NOT transcription complex subunit 1